MYRCLENISAIYYFPHVIAGFQQEYFQYWPHLKLLGGIFQDKVPNLNSWNRSLMVIIVIIPLPNIIWRKYFFWLSTFNCIKNNFKENCQQWKITWRSPGVIETDGVNNLLISLLVYTHTKINWEFVYVWASF